MARWRSKFRNSIRWRFLALTTTALILILAGAVYVLLSTLQLTHDYSRESATYAEKERLASDLAADAKQTIMHARGYVAFLTPYEYEQALSYRQRLNEHIDSLRLHPLTPAERDLLVLIDQAIDYVYDIRFPSGYELAEKHDYEALRNLIQADETNPTLELITYTERLAESIKNASDWNVEQLIKDLARQGLIFICYILLILGVSFFVVRRIATDINAPLLELSRTASKFSAGEPVAFEHTSRLDEVGRLASSLELMMRTIHEKEDALVAQNEELIAQQDELQMQQEELQEALVKAEDSRKLLRRRNALVQSLANTLDKRELLESIVRHMVEITSSDKGIILLYNARRDYASFGMSLQAAERFIASSDESLTVRILESKRVHVVERQGVPGELIDDTEAVRCTDVYVPVFSRDGKPAACLMLTKIGKPITTAEQEEMAGLATQISLALAKLAIYEESEYRRQLNYDMLNTIQEAVQLTDLTGKTLHVNATWHEWFGLVEPVLKPDAVELPLERYLAMMAGKVTNPDGFLCFFRDHFDGSMTESRNMRYEMIGDPHRVIQVYVEPLNRDGELFGVLLVHRDVTREYEIDRMKSEFVSTVSHELRTPLAGILGYAELLLHRDLKPERQRKYVTTIHQEAQRLTTLINDFLDLQRMESGRQRYDMNAVVMLPLIEQWLDAYRVRSEENYQFILRQEEAEHAVVFADRDKLKQVFENLLSNAVKYSPQGGTITVQLEIHDDQLSISVTDEGLGIPEEALPKLFEKFYRVDNTDRREIGGTGLGLSIVHEIVKRHRGDIQVVSKLGSGSTFTVTLPLLHKD